MLYPSEGFEPSEGYYNQTVLSILPLHCMNFFTDFLQSRKGCFCNALGINLLDVFANPVNYYCNVFYGIKLTM